MISSSSVTSLGIWAVPLIMLEQASYRSNNRTISWRGPKEGKKENLTITCHYSQASMEEKEKVYDSDSHSVRKIHCPSKALISIYIYELTGNVLPFSQCRLLCVEVCHPCCSADLHQHLPAWCDPCYTGWKYILHIIYRVTSALTLSNSSTTSLCPK